MAEPIIRFEGVSKSYGEQPVLKDFSLDVLHGEFLTVIGRSGCGKTTALKLGTRILVMADGRVQQCGLPSEILERPATPFVERLVCRSREFQARA